MNNLSASVMPPCLPDTLPPEQQFLSGGSRSPDRGGRLIRSQTVTVLENALLCIPQNFHDELIPEFLENLKTRAGVSCA